MVIMVGIGGSGKTTLAKKEYPAFVKISLDSIREMDFKDRVNLIKAYEPDGLPEPLSNTRRAEHVLLGKALASGVDLVVDDTNLTAEIRQHHILHGMMYGYSIHAISFQNTSRAREQNSKRSGKKRLKKHVIEIQKRLLEPPVVEEGFDSIRTIVW